MSVESTESRLTALERENERLSRAVGELSVLNDLARKIGASSSPADVMHTIVSRSLKAVHAEEGVVTLLDSEDGSGPRTLVREIASNASAGQFHLRQALIGWMQLNMAPLTVNDPENDERFGGVDWDSDVRSLLCAPLVVKSKLIGILTVYNKRGDGSFEDEDQRLLAIIASQSAQVLDNARLYEEELKLTRMKEQLHLAADVQRHLLPEKLPEFEGFEVAGCSVAAEVVGGDYYDAMPVDDWRWAICLGDVSGKGLPASLLMANVQAMMRMMASTGVTSSETMNRANELLCASIATSKFITFFLSILDTESSTLEYCNAGHNPPLHISRDGECRLLSTKGVVLGMVKGHSYRHKVAFLEPGDVIVIFSDGVTEALNEADEELGQEELIEVVRSARDRSASEVLELVFETVRNFAGKRTQSDDITLVVLKRLEEKA